MFSYFIFNMKIECFEIYIKSYEQIGLCVYSAFMSRLSTMMMWCLPYFSLNLLLPIDLWQPFFLSIFSLKFFPTAIISQYSTSYQVGQHFYQLTIRLKLFLWHVVVIVWHKTIHEHDKVTKLCIGLCVVHGRQINCESESIFPIGMVAFQIVWVSNKNV